MRVEESRTRSPERGFAFVSRIDDAISQSTCLRCHDSNAPTNTTVTDVSRRYSSRIFCRIVSVGRFGLISPICTAPGMIAPNALPNLSSNMFLRDSSRARGDNSREDPVTAAHSTPIWSCRRWRTRFSGAGEGHFPPQEIEGKSSACMGTELTEYTVPIEDSDLPLPKRHLYLPRSLGRTHSRSSTGRSRGGPFRRRTSAASPD